MYGNKPDYKTKVDNVRAAVWANETPHGIRYNVRLDRVYDCGDYWNIAETFHASDLPKVCKVADRAHKWIQQQNADVVDEAHLAASYRGLYTSAQQTRNTPEIKTPERAVSPEEPSIGMPIEVSDRAA